MVIQRVTSIQSTASTGHPTVTKKKSMTTLGTSGAKGIGFKNDFNYDQDFARLGKFKTTREISEGIGAYQRELNNLRKELNTEKKSWNG